MESRIRHVKSLLGKGSRDVCIIGIWGMGGIGKTTIARAVYRQISCEFEGSCFVEDVRENGSDKSGLKFLQEKILSDILMEEHFNAKDCEDGRCQIQRRLRRKKVLVVLDDVDNIKQLEFLAGSHEWFGSGNRIMVTTRDEHLLTYAQEKYVHELLDKTEAMKLFSRYAFKANIPPKGYEELSRDVVTYTCHLPLALKVLGSHFCGRNLDVWQSTLNVLAKIQHKEINGILKISYDGLNILEKKIFLHIACFFKGKERGYVTRILDSFGFEAVSGIAVLIEKSLLTVLRGNLHIHNLTQEMGRSIVREYYPNNMVWVPEEIKEVMTTIVRLETVEAIVKTDYDQPCYSAEVFKNMNKLRILEVNGGFTSSEPTYFPTQLRWLSWYLYPFQSLRIARDMTKLVGLEMPSGRMKQLQIEKKAILTNLKFMDITNSWAITTSPDVSGVPNIERLNLSCCSYLVEVNQSVVLHERIIHLNLSFCENLKIFPSPIHMKSLQTLLLNYCKSLEKLPEVSSDMGSLLVLEIYGCERIWSFPSSIRHLIGLNVLIMGKISVMDLELEQALENFGRIRALPNDLCIHDYTHLYSLRAQSLRLNNILEHGLPSDLYIAWPSLEELDLSGNMFTWLPTSIFQLSHLKYLDLRGCIKLKELHELPSLIQVLMAFGCQSLQKIGDLSNKFKWLFKISLHRCPRLLKDQESPSHIANVLMKSLVQKCAAVNHRLSVAVPGCEIPNWFSNQRLGKEIMLELNDK